MKLRFGIKNQTDGRTDERTNGDIEALADARRALKKAIFTKPALFHMFSFKSF
jgi:hypothetical protein